MKLRELIDYSIFVLISPLLGTSGAIKMINDESWNKMEEGDAGSGFRAELYRAAINYEQAGTGADSSFEFLNNALRINLEKTRRDAGEALSSVLMVVIGLSISMILTMLLGGSSIFFPIMLLAMIPLIHYFQVEVTKYDYTLPSILGAVVGITTLLITKNYSYSLIAGSIAFSGPYIAQFKRSFIFIGPIKSTVMNSFNELMWSPDPTPLPTGTLIGEEFERLFEAARTIGAPLFLSKVNRVVYDMLSWIEDNNRTLLLYGLVIPIPYILLCMVTRILAINVIPMQGPFPILPSLNKSREALMMDGIVSSILTGKSIHSIGVGIMLIPIFIAAQIVIA
ncbi:MAG: hypothetical protein ACP5NY_06650 [Thermocladium sp.]